MGDSFGSQVRFGRRALPTAAACKVRAEDVRRSVAALNTLSRGDRTEPLARASCLYYALRSYTGGVPIDALVSGVNARVAAFEWLIATRPRLISRENVSAALEAAVYEAVATEPIIDTEAGPRFDSTRFEARLPILLAQQAGTPSPAPATEAGNPAFWVARAS